MALFSMRDSWNVWRRKVNEALGGMVEPVKSEDVTYDGTSSGLSATNVQSAIDEVAGEISGLDGADVAYDNTDSGLSATTVQGAIDEVSTSVSNITSAMEVFEDGLVYKGNKTITFKFTGTIQDALKAMADAIVAEIATYTENYTLVPYRFIASGYFVGNVAPTAWTNTAESVDISFYATSTSATELVNYGGTINSTLGNNYMNRVIVSSGATTFQALTSTTVTDKDFTLNYELYEKIV